MANPDINNPASLIDEDGLPMTPFAIDELRHARIRELNDKRERNRLRRANAKRGFEQPKVGQTYHIQLDGSITRRSRGADPAFPGVPGIRFERNKRVEVTVVSDDEFQDVKSRHPDAPVVTVHGAERILEDDALHVFEAPMADADVEQLVQERDWARSELKLQAEENARLNALVAEMRARRTAPESKDGQPTKLPAQQAARAAAAQASAPAAKPVVTGSATANDFGGEPEKK